MCVVLNDMVGGVFSLNAALLATRRPGGPRYEAVLLRNAAETAGRSTEPLDADQVRTFTSDLPRDNLFTVLRRLHASIAGRGVLVANDGLELAACTIHRCGRSVVLIVHDEYHLGLAVRYAGAIDAFVAHSEYIHRRLGEALPARRASIHHVPYGIHHTSDMRQPSTGRLRLVFIGRITEAKGVLDLPRIDRALLHRGIDAEWTVIGNGPLRERLREEWGDRDVRWCAPGTGAEVRKEAARHDIFVFPTRFEGFPVALLEAMSVGLVPVASDLPSGVPEVVSDDTGVRAPTGDIEAFATAIAALHGDRPRLERLSANASALVRGRYDITTRGPQYHELFERLLHVAPEWRRGRVNAPSRLDRPWLPNVVVRTLRRAALRLRRGGA